MKKTLFTLAIFIALLAGLQSANAQTPFKSAIGIVFDGNNGSNIGIQYKMGLTSTTAAQFQAAFGNHWTTFGADYQYEKSIDDVEGLAWYVGGGAHLGFLSGFGNSTLFFGIRPQVGLEYAINEIPLAMHLDYKPTIGLINGGGFNGGGFTFGIKYILK